MEEEMLADKKLKNCMCGCIYEQAECPNCNKIPDRELIARLRNPKTFDGLPSASDIKEAADRIEEYARAFANLQREYDARGERIAELERSLEVAVQTVAESGRLRGQAEARAERLEAALREAAAAWEAFKAATTSADHFAAVDRLDAALIGEAQPAQAREAALIEAALEWREAQSALNTFEAENPSNTTKRWVNLLRDKDRAEEVFWNTLALIGEART